METQIKLKAIEREVLKQIANGKTDREIAMNLHRGYSTIRLYIMGLFKTFRTNSRAEMVYMACKEGILN